MNPKRICIIGGGVAGLTAARDLGMRGYEVTVFETCREIGGLAASLSCGEVTIENFHHFICRGDNDLLRLLAELHLSNEVHWVKSRTAFFHEGQLYNFSSPVDLLRFSAVPLFGRLRFGFNVFNSCYRKNWRRLDGVSAKRWLVDHVGQEAYDVIWDPLLRVKFGDYHEQVSAAWIWHRIHRVAMSREHSWTPEMLGYIASGTSALITALRNALGAMPNVTVKVGVKANRILTESGRVSGVVLDDGETTACSAVVSTVALANLVKLVDGFDEAYRHRLSRIDYIGVVCGLLKLKEPITDAFWVNVNDSQIPFNGIVEYTNLNQHARRAIRGKSLVYVPSYLRTESARYHMDDETLKQEFIAGLARINPRMNASWVEECHISRAKYAQAICTVGFANLIPDHRTPLPGLYLTDSTQYYPEDRTVSAAVRLGRRVAELLREDFQTARAA